MENVTRQQGGIVLQQLFPYNRLTFFVNSTIIKSHFHDFQGPQTGHFEHVCSISSIL